MKNPLTPRWQHEDAAVRATAVASGKLSDDILKQLAADDPDSVVRETACELITDHDFLLKLAHDRTDAAVRWVALISIDLQNLGQLEGQKPFVLSVVAKHADKEEFRLAAVEALNEDALHEILLTDNLSRVHQHCASAIQSEALLAELQKHFVDRDKNVSRILKSKLQVIKHDREVENTKAEGVAQLFERIDKLHQSEPDQDYERRIALFRSEWQQLEDKSTPEAVKAKELLNDCEEIVAALPNPEEQKELAVQDLTNRCTELRERCKSNANLESLDESLNTILADWPEDLEQEARAKQTQDLVSLVAAQQRWRDIKSAPTQITLDEYQQKIAGLEWPAEFPAPADLTQVTSARISKLEVRAAKHAELEQHKADLTQTLSKLELEIEEGHIKAANRANTKLTRLLHVAKPSSDQSSQAQQLQAKLQELKDWQGFATQPKRDDLCAKMQVLAEDQSIAMPEKAKAIKELQEEWRKLGSSDSRPAQKSWSTFKTLGDKAYAPVAEYFAEQEVLRKQHLTAREEICQSLEALHQDTDWDNTDLNWRGMASSLQSHSAKFRQHNNVPRRAKKSIEKRFSVAYEAINLKLDTEQKKNIERKEALIQNLKASLEDDTRSVNDSINLAKSSQQDWKKIGFVDRRKDQKLWKRFRSTCDAAFAQRDEEQKTIQSAETELAQKFKAHCKAFQDSLDGSFEKRDIATFRKEIAGFELAKSQRGLEREASKLIKQAESLLKDRARQNEELMFREFQKRCKALDQGQSEATSSEQEDTDITLSAELNEAIANRQSRSIEDQDLILIRLEILAELPSPDDSQGARMAYQVERLNRGLSKGIKETRSEREQVRALLVEWFTTSDKGEIFAQRFQNIGNKLGLPV